MVVAVSAILWFLLFRFGLVWKRGRGQKTSEYWVWEQQNSSCNITLPWKSPYKWMRLNWLIQTCKALCISNSHRNKRVLLTKILKVWWLLTGLITYQIWSKESGALTKVWERNKRKQLWSLWYTTGVIVVCFFVGTFWNSKTKRICFYWCGKKCTLVVWLAHDFSCVMEESCSLKPVVICKFTTWLTVQLHKGLNPI